MNILDRTKDVKVVQYYFKSKDLQPALWPHIKVRKKKNRAEEKGDNNKQKGKNNNNRKKEDE